MTDPDTIDMAPFFARHDRRTRWTYIVMLWASLLLSAITYLRAQLAVDVPGQALGALWMPVVQGPLTIALLWITTTLYDRTRPPAQPDGSFPMNRDDAHNVERVANAGAVFVTGFCLVAIAGQLAWLLWKAGVLPNVDDWGLRAVLVAAGALSAYFGNVSPRMPIPRAPEAKPAVRLRYNRWSGWLTVLLGLLVVAGALLLPHSALVPAIGIVSVSALVVMAVGWVTYRRALSA